ncbi:6952_t:CDS:1, partial [Funneliformis caledonium]
GNANIIIELDKDENNSNIIKVSQLTLDNALFVQGREITLLEKRIQLEEKLYETVRKRIQFEN